MGDIGLAFHKMNISLELALTYLASKQLIINRLHTRGQICIDQLPGRLHDSCAVRRQLFRLSQQLLHALQMVLPGEQAGPQAGDTLLHVVQLQPDGGRAAAAAAAVGDEQLRQLGGQLAGQLVPTRDSVEQLEQPGEHLGQPPGRNVLQGQFELLLLHVPG